MYRDNKTRWTLKLPYQKPPLNMNQRLHWAKKARLTKNVRSSAYFLARSQRIPAYRHIKVQLHYVPRDNRRRDPSNLIATQKPLVDGLVTAGVVPDDTPKYVTEAMPKIHPADKTATVRMWLTIDAGDPKQG